MARIVSWTLIEADLPFRRPFRHAAAERSVSGSVFLKCETDGGIAGWGECLPRPYVTGESREGVVAVLRDRVLPRMLGMSFGSFGEVEAFLDEHDGQAPAGWTGDARPRTAAWCAVDLALLDAFGKRFGHSIHPTSGKLLSKIRYSGVVSAGRPRSVALACLAFRLFGIRQIKLKVGESGDERDIASVRLARRIMGRRADLRVDANMAWIPEQAAIQIPRMADLGVRSFEQPLPAHDVGGMAKLVERTDALIMADESITDRDSLRKLIDSRACTAVNIRISKCGGFRAALKRCWEALDAGLAVQVGCQVGESSLLSAAQLALLGRVAPVAYAEGCYGHYLLAHDCAEPSLQFGFGGRPPRITLRTGLGVTVDDAALDRWIRSREVIR